MKQHLLKYTAGLSAFALLLAGCGESQKTQSSTPETSSVPISSSTTASSAAESDGLYELGQAVSGTEQIEALTGEIRIRSLQDGDFEENGNTLSSHPEQPSVLVQQEPADTNREERAEMKMNVQIDGHVFKATLEDNAAVEAFAEMMQEAPVVIQMRDYSGFEKVGSLETSLPASDQQTTTQAGDIVLYTGNQIVMFYGSNSWSYTRLGKIDDLTGWEDALGSGNVTVTFSLS